MTVTRVAKVVGWGIVAAAAALWVRVLGAGMGTECMSNCWENGLWVVAAGTLTFPGVGVAGWILAFAYERGPAGSAVSSPVGVLAKVGRILAYGSLPLAIASLVLIFVVGPLAILIALWNVATGQLMSTAAVQLDRVVRPGLLSNGSQWAVAVVVCTLVVGAGGLAAGTSL